MSGGVPGSQPRWLRAALVPLYALALWAVLDKGWDRRTVWRTDLVDKGIGGDGIQYWQMAVHLERAGMISLDGKEPTWLRLPGYPVLLRYTTRPAESANGPTGPKDIQERIDAWLKRAVRVNLLVDLCTGGAAALLGFALGGGPVALLSAGIWAWQPWSSVVAIHTLSDPLAALLTTLSLAALVAAVRDGRRWGKTLLSTGAVLAALAQYVRADSIVLLPALAVAGYLSIDRHVRRVGHRRLGRALLALAVWAAVFAPWPARNLKLFGHPYPLGSSGIDAKGNPVDRSAAFEFMRTWCVGREQETMRVAWRLPSQSLGFKDFPSSAYDNAEEISDLKYFLLEYQLAGSKLDERLSATLRSMAARRRARDPLAYWVTLPLERIKLRLLPPRDGYGMGTLASIRDHRDELEERDALVVKAALVGLLVLLLRPSRRGAALVAVVWLLGRFALIGWIPAPEPRYFLEALPLLAAAATTLPASVLASLLALWQRVRARPLTPRGDTPA